MTEPIAYLNGRFVRVIGKRNREAGTGDGEFRDPVGIDVAPDGRVIVADTLNDRIQVFDRQGRHVGSWPAGFTILPNRGLEAHLVAAPNGTVFVTDPHGGHVFAFGPDGTKIMTWDRAGSGERFRLPTGIALAADGTLLVTDLHWHKVLPLRVR